MINKKNNFFVGVICITMMSLFTSCDKVEDSDTGGTAVEDIASDWTVEILRDGSEFASGHLSTYNTAGNTSDKLWIDDQKDGWGLKSKVDLNLSSKTFSGTDLDELYFDVTVTITDGVVIKNGTTAPSGTETDSIYFKAVFSDVPNSVFEYYGHKRTGFAEDE